MIRPQLSSAIYPHLIRWLLCNDILNESIDMDSVADEIHECVANQGFYRINDISSKLLSMYHRDHHSRHYVHQFIPLFVLKYIDLISSNSYDFITKHETKQQQEYKESLEIFILAVYNLSLKNLSHEYLRAPAIEKEKTCDDQHYEEKSGRRELLRVLQFAGKIFKPIQSLHSNTNQENVLLRLLILFNESITCACWQARQQLCSLAICLADKDINSTNTIHVSKSLSMFTTEIAIELLSCLHFLCKNDGSTTALNAIHALNKRARDDLNPRMMLCAKSVINLVQLDEESVQESGKKDVSGISRASITGQQNSSRDTSTRSVDMMNMQGKNDPVQILTDSPTTNTRTDNVPHQQSTKIMSIDAKRKMSMLDELDYIEIENLPGLASTDPNFQHTIEKPEESKDAKNLNSKDKFHWHYSMLSRRL
ncbi:hypothetical protein GJ496_009311 [Pomphorhynchus laevis]|nr:hypothetical protein GJ496_009311 [Pomphorhynchus laevis]